MQIIGKARGKKGRGAFREVHYVDTRSPSLPRPSERGEALEKAQSPVLAEILTALVIKALVLREPPLPFRRDRLKPPDPRNPVLHAPRNQVEPREERRKIREEKFSNDLGEFNSVKLRRGGGRIPCQWIGSQLSLWTGGEDTAYVTTTTMMTRLHNELEPLLASSSFLFLRFMRSSPTLCKKERYLHKRRRREKKSTKFASLKKLINIHHLLFPPCQGRS